MFPCARMFADDARDVIERFSSTKATSTWRRRAIDRASCLSRLAGIGRTALSRDGCVRSAKSVALAAGRASYAHRFYGGVGRPTDVRGQFADSRLNASALPASAAAPAVRTLSHLNANWNELLRSAVHVSPYCRKYTLSKKMTAPRNRREANKASSPSKIHTGPVAPVAKKLFVADESLFFAKVIHMHNFHGNITVHRDRQDTAAA